MTTSLTIGQCATLACLLEASAPKAGNVHRGADFDDVTFVDFAVSAVAIAPACDAAADAGVGATVLEGVRATQQFVRTNTNLGLLLLLAPLCAVPRDESLGTGVLRVLGRLTPEDAGNVYEAIRLARPGGLGHAERHDVASSAPADLLAAMSAAAGRDLVARQYATGFGTVMQIVAPWLTAEVAAGRPLMDAIVHVQLRLLREYPDSLIARKCGPAVAAEASAYAAAVLDAGPPDSDDYYRALADFDFWLRSDGHRRNPGTTADLIGAGLFVALREGTISPAG